ncbi:MAG: molecular chaperone DnaJ [Prochlorococcus sp. SP3034]|nr:molecular chaperone DnaJ [Prochlorococcus sp. SP3034]|tara:strand:+ start:2159 stop:2839 length:681 start_codon:yes stop_codon:yes gene_type:complete
MQRNNYYSIFGVNKDATKTELKAAYRSLVKKYHPDTGGDKEKFLLIQLAWETLNDPIKKEKYDKKISFSNESLNIDNENWVKDLKGKKQSSNITDSDIKAWMNNIYLPINKSISEIIKPLNNEIKKLSDDPYDETLMNSFCHYIAESQKKIEKASLKYKSQAVPEAISSLGLDLYHCFSQVQDALDEFDRYTQGYVDNYLFDGKQMMREAKMIQKKMMIYKKNISF